MAKVREDRVKVPTLTVLVRYANFEQESRGQSVAAATDIEAPFYPLVTSLLRAAWRRERPLRLVSVRLSGVDGGPAQLEMFGQAEEKRRALAGVMDRLNRGGRDPVVMHGHQLPPERSESKDTKRRPGRGPAGG
jgi:DNA polymerase-4